MEGSERVGGGGILMVEHLRQPVMTVNKIRIFYSLRD